MPPVVLAAAALSAGVMFAFETLRWGDGTGRAVVGCVLMLFAGVAGLAIFPSMRCRPARAKVVDAGRGIFRFRAQNPDYTRLLIDQIDAHDGRGAA